MEHGLWTRCSAGRCSTGHLLTPGNHTSHSWAVMLPYAGSAGRVNVSNFVAPLRVRTKERGPAAMVAACGAVVWLTLQGEGNRECQA